MKGAKYELNFGRVSLSLSPSASLSFSLSPSYVLHVLINIDTMNCSKSVILVD